MQSAILDRKPAARGRIAPVNFQKNQDAASARKTENTDGLIIVKKGDGVYYVRYDIIFAKAGDVFFMPRRVPEGFNSDTDRVIPFSASAGEFDKFNDEHFLPVEREHIRHFASLAASLQ